MWTYIYIYTQQAQCAKMTKVGILSWIENTMNRVKRGWRCLLSFEIASCPVLDGDWLIIWEWSNLLRELKPTLQLQNIHLFL